MNYNGTKYLKDCFESIFRLDYPNYDVMIIDNASTDGSVEYIQKNFKNVKVLRLPVNRGPNVARNFALLNTQNRYLFLLDNDAIVTKDCLRSLVNIITKSEDAVICSPLIVDKSHPERVQYGPTHIHYIGAAIIETNNLSSKALSVATTINGTALLIDRDRANKVGVFDEDMFFGWTDGDYSFRLTASGYKCLTVHQAKVLYPKTKRSKLLVLHQVQNRWLFMLKTYSWRTIFVILPALVVYEPAVFVFLSLTGHLKEYFRAVNGTIQSLPNTLKKRKEFFKTKKMSDSALLRSGDFLSAQFILKNKYLKKITLLVNTMLDTYWNLAKRFVK